MQAYSVTIDTDKAEYSRESFLALLDAGAEQDDGSIIVAVTDEDDERSAQDVIVDGWGEDAAGFFAAGWQAEWTGNGNTGADGDNTSDVRLTPPAAE